MQDREYEYAGFWIRTGASLIDSILAIIIIAPIIIGIHVNYDMLISIAFFNDSSLGYMNIFINYILPFVATILFWVYKSATPGKLFLRLKIVDEASGSKLTLTQSIIRYFAYIPAILIFMLGIFWVAHDRRKQGWHDKIAKTVVLRESKPVDDVKFESKI